MVSNWHESTLKGVPGKILNEVDVLGRQVSFSKERYIDAIDSYDVYLTIDETIQYLAEKAMDQAVLDYDLKRGATCIVMEPNTAEVLAMVSKPVLTLMTRMLCLYGFRTKTGKALMIPKTTNSSGRRFSETRL